MWCGRPIFLSKEEFKVKKQVERKGKTNTTELSTDFKVALAAVTFNED